MDAADDPVADCVGDCAALVRVTEWEGTGDPAAALLCAGSADAEKLGGSGGLGGG